MDYYNNTILFRDLMISPPLILAPMAGLTHSALRCLLLKFGGIGLLSTEMLSARGLPNENPKVSPYLIRKPNERPLSYQLLIRNDTEIYTAIEKLHQLEADAIDINMGCPAPDIKKSGGGASIMDDFEKALKIVKITRKSTQLPLSCKIRLGKKFHGSYLKSFCKMLEDEGIDLITIHARFSQESFERPPRWEIISEIKCLLKIPIIANGGIFNTDDARKCLDVSGADGLMIGRASAIKPWIFRDISKGLFNITYNPNFNPSFREIYQIFSQELQENFPKERQLGRLKEWTHYYSKNFFYGHILASSVQSSRTLTEAIERAEEFFKLIE